jgi:predicted ABC-type ATPase
MDVSNTDKYTLPPEEHQKIRQRISRRELANSVQTDKPCAIILAGQPGAGKSGLTKAAIKELAPKGGAVVVDTDELRAEYRNKKGSITYDKLCAADDRSAADLVQNDAGQWAKELTQDAIAHRRNVIIDGTLKTKENALDLCEGLKGHGYEVDVRVMAVAREDSIQSVYARYEDPKATRGKPGRWVPETVHYDAYEGLVTSIDAIERRRMADQISVYKRGMDGDDPPVLIHTGRGAVEALKTERARERTPKELAARHEAWNREAESPAAEDAGIMQRIRARDPELTEPQNRRAAELAAEAREKSLSATTKQASAAWTKHSTATKETGTPWVKHSTSTKEAAGPWVKHSTSAKEAAGPWVKHSTSGKETGTPWVKHSTSTNKAAEPQAKHSKSSPQQKAGPKSPVKGR